MSILDNFFKDLILRRARDLCWDELPKDVKAEYLAQAKILVEESQRKLVLKVCKEVEEAMEKKDYVSRTDPEIYLEK